MAIVCSQREMLSLREISFASYPSSLPIERSIPTSVLGHRRHAFSSGSGGSPLDSNPRMMRRGAVSYEETDITAQYIRFLGKHG